MSLNGLVLAFAVALPFVGGATAIEAGFARIDITPPVGAYIPGYFTERIAEGADTPLVADCVAFSGQGRRAVVISVDNTHLTRANVGEIRSRIWKRLSIPEERVFVHSTHTHQSAATDLAYYASITNERARALCESYGREVVERIVKVASEAIGDLAPARFAFARNDVNPPVSFVRRYRMKDGDVRTNPPRTKPENVACALGDADNSVQVVRIRRSGKPDIALVNFQTHPDTIGNNRFNADWPGVFRKAFEGALADGTQAFFMNGAQGDTNHIQVLGTDPFWRSHPLADYYLHIGRAVAGAALAVWDSAADAEAKGAVLGKISVATVSSNRPAGDRLKALQLIDSGRAAEIRGMGKMEIKALADKDGNARRLVVGPDSFQVPLATLSIGNVLAFAGFPGEPFTEIGLKIKAGSPFGMTFVGCFVNDSMGYMPSSSAMREGGYEVIDSLFGPECADVLARSQLDSLNELYSKR